MSGQLYVNGKIFTGRSEDDFVSAVRVQDGRIAWTGNANNVAEQGVVDLEGRTVLPGFIDAHTHPTLVARTLAAVACITPHVNSIEEMIEALRRSPRAGRASTVWIEGWGYDESKLAEQRTPTTKDLDKVSTRQPVFVMRSDCHSGVCNTRALELAGITRDTPDPRGATFGRYDNGEPNGILTEIAANAAVLSAKGVPDYAEAVRELARSADHFNERGIIAVTDLMALQKPYDYLAVYRDAARRGMKQRAILYYDWADMSADPIDGLPTSALDGDVKIGGIKIFMDGSISNRTAWVVDRYPGSDDLGMTTVTDEAIQRAHRYARHNKIQMVFHAMGDRAIQHIIDLLGGAEPWLEGIPSVRLDHCTLMTREQIAQIKAARMSFGVVTQIIFFFAEHDSYVQNLSAAQYRRAYPVKDLYAGLDHLAMSSDAPATTWAEPDNVFTSIKAAVDRRAYNGADIVQEQAISVAQAVLLYTGRAQHLAPFPDLGKIAKGYDASFVVLDRDIFSVPAQEIGEVRVEQTYIRGQQVFQR